MKTYLKLFILILSFPLLHGVTAAQDDDDGEIKMSQEEWHLKRDQYAVSAIQLLRRIDNLDSLIDSLRRVNREADSIILNAESDLYALVGATGEQVNDFRNKFGSLESNIKNKNGTPDALRSEFDEISSSRITCLPEFADRFELLKKKISEFETVKSEVKTFPDDRYVISEGDCLWRISELKYGNPDLWPIIWDANKISIINIDYFYDSYMKRISNPNLIFPGQEIKIPKIMDTQKKPN